MVLALSLAEGFGKEAWFDRALAPELTPTVPLLLPSVSNLPGVVRWQSLADEDFVRALLISLASR